MEKGINMDNNSNTNNNKQQIKWEENFTQVESYVVKNGNPFEFSTKTL